MTPCERFRDKIFDLVDQELDDSLREEVEQHISECDLCRKFYEGLVTLRKRIRQIKPVEAPDSFSVVLRERIRREKAHKKGFGIRPAPVPWWIPAAAVVVLMVLASIVVFHPFSIAGSRESAAVEAGSVQDDGEYRNVQFVIDDLGGPEAGSVSAFNGAPVSPIDSLLSEASAVSPFADLIQPVRF